MALTIQNDIPPIFSSLFQKLDEKQSADEKITINDFREMLFGLRISREDVDKLADWFIQRGLIAKTKNYVIVTIVKEIKE